MTTKTKVIIGIVGALGATAFLTRKIWMLPYIKISISSDKKTFDYTLFADGNEFSGSESMESEDTLKKQIGEYEFKVYPPKTMQNNIIKAFIYKGEADAPIVSVYYDTALEKVDSSVKKQHYYDVFSSTGFKVFGFCSLLYMGIKLNYTMHKQSQLA